VRYVVLDFESASACDLLKCGAWKYSQDFSTYLTHVGFKVVVDHMPRPTRVIWRGGELNRVDPELYELASDPEVMFVAHNCSFEIGMWREHMVTLGYPDIPNERYHDTMAVAASRSLPLGLDPLTKALDLPIQKDMEGHRLMLQLCKPDKDGGWSHHTPEKLQREAEYNVVDVDSQYSAHLALGGLGEERKVWLIDQRINQRGILVDVPFVRACMDVLDQVRVPMTAEFKELTGGISPTQREKVLNWVNEQGVPMDDMRKATLDAMLDPDDDFGFEDMDQLGIAPLPYHVHRVLTLRRSLASSSVAKLERMLQCATADGRVRYTMQYHGAGTGRWAGRLNQIQNYPRGEIQERQGLTPEILAEAIMSRDLDRIRELWGPDIFTAVISSLRSCIVPDVSKGRVLTVGDFAQVEARNVLSFAGHHDRALEMDTTDAYAELGSLIFKMPVNKKDNPKERQVGKNGLLGSGFGLGYAGFQAKFAPKEPFELAVRAIDAYRKEYAPMVPKFWYGLYQASVDAVWCNQARTYAYAGIEFRREGDFLTMRLPSGRKIYYHKPNREKSYNPTTGNEYPAWSFCSYQGKKTRRIFMWYGQLMNNLVQGSARDLVVNAIFICEQQGLPVVFTAHDEVVLETLDRPGLAVMLKQIMEDIPAWARERRFNVKAETDTMIRYRK